MRQQPWPDNRYQSLDFQYGQSTVFVLRARSQGSDHVRNNLCTALHCGCILPSTLCSGPLAPKAQLRTKGKHIIHRSFLLMCEGLCTSCEHSSRHCRTCAPSLQSGLAPNTRGDMGGKGCQKLSWTSEHCAWQAWMGQKCVCLSHHLLR